MVKLERTELLNELYEFSINESGVVIGKPGIGKSYLLTQLRQKLHESGILSLIIRIDNTLDFSDDAIQEELEITENWIETLQDVYLEYNQKAVLIFDAFDAARDENIRRGFLRQIQKAKNHLFEKWNILVSVRTYDALKSPDLIHLFPLEVGTADPINCQKIEIPYLEEGEILKAINSDEALLKLYNDSSFELKEILKIPFFLVLLETITNSSSTSELEEIKQYKSETQLLRRFWTDKIDKPSLEKFLLEFTNALVDNRKLNISRNEALSNFTPYTDSTFTYLRSENIIDEISSSKRLAYSHNILFDYAVSVFCISEDYNDLISFINIDSSRPFFLRPSFIYFFTNLWYEEREMFWKLYWKLYENKTKEIQLLVRLVLNGVIVSEYTTTDDFAPILSYPFKKTKIEVLRNILQSIKSLRNQINTKDIDFLLLLSNAIEIELLFDLAFLLDRAVNRNLGKDEFEKCGVAARNIFYYILTKRKSENKFHLDQIGARQCVELISRTYSTNKIASKEILSALFDIQREPDFEIQYFSQLCEYIKYFVHYDPEFVGEIYEVVFAHIETSDQQTRMGSSVLMNLMSSRRQDYGMCYFALEEFFPTFLVAAPLIAIPVGLRVVNYRIALERRVPNYFTHQETFNYHKLECKYVVDRSHSWAEGLHSLQSEKIVYKITDYLEKLIAEDNSLYSDIVVLYIQHAIVGFIWKQLLKIGIKYPKQLTGLLYPLIIVPLIMKSPDTSYEVRKLIEKAIVFLSNEEIEKIEETIFEVHNEENEYTITSILSSIPNNKLQLEKSREFTLDKQKIENEPGFASTFSSGILTTEMWLEEHGVDVKDVKNKELIEISNQLERFNQQHLNDTLKVSDSYEYFILAKKLYDKLIDSNIDKSERLFYSMLNAVTKTMVIISKNMDGLSDEDVETLRNIIAYSFSYKTKHENESSNFSGSHIWSPTPRNDASEGLINLFQKSKDEKDLNLFLTALQDEHSVVRLHAVVGLEKLKAINKEIYWQTLLDRLSKEEDAYVYSRLFSQMEFDIDKIESQAEKIIDLINNKKSFFVNEKSEFINNYANFLVWLLLAHKSKVAIEALMKAHDNPTLCHSIIFHGFKKMHPFYPQNDFINNPKRFELFIEVIRKFVDESGKILINTTAADLNKENPSIKNALSTLNEIITRIYFQLDNERVANNTKLPINEENRRAFYFLIKPVYTDVISLSSTITDKGLILASTAYYFLQSLNKVFHYDPKNILQMIADITKLASSANYTFDYSAITEMVSLTEKLLTDHRDLLLDNTAFKNLIDLLDIYINSGWVEALQLLWRLDEIFE